MKTREIIFGVAALVVAAALGFWAGYKRGQYHWNSPHPGGITLADVLLERGISPKSIAYMRFLGNENSWTPGQVATTTAGDVEFIWDRMIETAEPYGFWESSGFLRAEIYTHTGPQPAATLGVNVSDATYIEGDGRTFMCHGLCDVVMQSLSKAQTTQPH